MLEEVEKIIRNAKATVEKMIEEKCLEQKRMEPSVYVLRMDR